MVNKILILIVLFSYLTLAEQDTTIYTNTEHTSTFAVGFSQPMDTTELCNPNNYSIVNTKTGQLLKIIGIGIMLEFQKKPVTDNSYVLLITERADYKVTYNLTVTGVKGKNGEYIGDKNNLNYFFSGLSSDIIKPKPKIQRRE